MKKFPLNDANFSMQELHKLAWIQSFQYEKWDHYDVRYKTKSIYKYKNKSIYVLSVIKKELQIGDL